MTEDRDDLAQILLRGLVLAHGWMVNRDEVVTQDIDDYDEDMSTIEAALAAAKAAGVEEKEP